MNASKNSKPTGGARPRATAGKGKRAPKNVVTAARTATSRRGTYLVAAVVILIAVLVIGGVFYQHSRTTAANNGYGAAKTAAVTVNAGVVHVGAPNAPVTLNVYEDFTCPICGQFEGVYGQQLAQAQDQGKTAVDYHMLDFLDSRSAVKEGLLQSRRRRRALRGPGRHRLGVPDVSLRTVRRGHPTTGELRLGPVQHRAGESRRQCRGLTRRPAMHLHRCTGHRCHHRRPDRANRPAGVGQPGSHPHHPQRHHQN